ncbi:DJ-1/PfpI family protein [Leisingera sp. M658]|uniref:DJ-1/PfpI family protein n=1 Tax=Leisingera sp. M658 TaxID=2867015 RepID=UPI0021A72E7B|nr:DJ-1/PfpI family protein [Leisingera sp. M658]UWQ77134.1 DJ-1/PfpI family protein [Leisingera sp. M658]
MRSSSGLQITPDGGFDEHAGNRTLVLVAGYRVRGQLSPALLAKLRTAARQAKLVLALDTAAWLLAAAGLLNGHTARSIGRSWTLLPRPFPRPKSLPRGLCVPARSSPAAVPAPRWI